MSLPRDTEDGCITRHLLFAAHRLSTRAVVPHGTGTVVIDPHEYANVLGLDGIRYILESSKNLPLDSFVMMPSCVPATHLETAGAQMTADDLKPMLSDDREAGVAELMNDPVV